MCCPDNLNSSIDLSLMHVLLQTLGKRGKSQLVTKCLSKAPCLHLHAPVNLQWPIAGPLMQDKAMEAVPQKILHLLQDLLA